MSPPPELSVGGKKETWWTGEWDGNSLGLAESHREHWDFGTCYVVQVGGAPSPLRNVPSKGRKRRSGRDKGRRRLAGPDGKSRETQESSFRVHLSRRAIYRLLRNDP